LRLIASNRRGRGSTGDLAAPLGVSVPTISQWLSILETTGQILLVPPFYENFGKRLVKSPKLHFVDSGLACHLLNISSERELGRSPFLG
jgi:predicted AAA+ superfamily ATPase